MEKDTTFIKKRAPALYFIIACKLLKGSFFIALACMAYALSDNDLPLQYDHFLQFFHFNPERKFWADLAVKVGGLTEVKVLWVAVGTFMYSLFALVEGIGLIYRWSWAGWLAIGESAFFIPIEIYDLIRHFTWAVVVIMAFNIFIVWYLFRYRERLFRHHHH